MSSVDLNRAQLAAAIALYGGHEDPEVEITLSRTVDGHSGPGLYAYWSEVPDAGATFLPEEPETLPAPAPRALRWLTDAEMLECASRYFESNVNPQRLLEKFCEVNGLVMPPLAETN